MVAEPAENVIAVDPTIVLDVEIPQQCVKGVVENLRTLQSHARILERFMDELDLDHEAWEADE